jgi:hypothetical protein
MFTDHSMLKYVVNTPKLGGENMMMASAISGI